MSNTYYVLLLFYKIFLQYILAYLSCNKLSAPILELSVWFFSLNAKSTLVSYIHIFHNLLIHTFKFFFKFQLVSQWGGCWSLSEQMKGTKNTFNPVRWDLNLKACLLFCLLQDLALSFVVITFSSEGPFSLGTFNYYPTFSNS